MRQHLASYALLAPLFVITWSSGFIGAGLGTQFSTAPNLLMWRFITLAVLLVGLQIGIRRRRPSLRVWLTQGLIGILSQSVYLLSMFLAVQLGVSSGTVSVVDALQPVVATVLAGFLLGENIVARHWIGVAVGLVGTMLVVVDNVGQQAEIPLWRYAIPFIGLGSLIAATVIQRKVDTGDNRVSVLDSLAIQCVFSAGFFSVVSALFDHADPGTSFGYWGSIAWLIVLSTFGGYGLYWVILKRTSVIELSMLIYLTGPCTVLWAYFFFGDEFTPLTVAGMLICLFAVIYVNRNSATTRTAAAEPGVTTRMG